MRTARVALSALLALAAAACSDDSSTVAAVRPDADRTVVALVDALPSPAKVNIVVSVDGETALLGEGYVDLDDGCVEDTGFAVLDGGEEPEAAYDVIRADDGRTYAKLHGTAKSWTVDEDLWLDGATPGAAAPETFLPPTLVGPANTAEGVFCAIGDLPYVVIADGTGIHLDVDKLRQYAAYRYATFADLDTAEAAEAAEDTDVDEVVARLSGIDIEADTITFSLGSEDKVTFTFAAVDSRDVPAPGPVPVYGADKGG